MREKLRSQKLVVSNESELIGDCPICFSELENPTTLLGCAHKACTECLHQMVSSSSLECPVVCKIESCNKPLFIDDIKRLSNDNSYTSICETALNIFMANHSAEYRRCPRIGCQQILQMPKQSNSPIEERQVGGQKVVYCDQCLMSYCLTCSIEKDAYCLAHPKKLCLEMALENDPTALKHRRALENILNPKCPSCQRVFEYFTGCCAVTCDGCKNVFCGLCLIYFSNNSNDTHSHVIVCSDNPRQGGYFVDENIVRNIWRKRNEGKINDYLNSIHDVKIREALRNDFMKMV